MQKAAHIPRSALALAKLCTKNKKDVQRSSIHIDDDAVVATNGVILVAAQTHGTSQTKVSIGADDIRKILSHVASPDFHIKALDDSTVVITGTDIRGVVNSTLRSQRTSVDGWRDEFKNQESICQLCLSIDDMTELLRVMKAAADLKGALSGTGFGVFIDVCKKGDNLYLIVRLRNAQHSSSIMGIIQSLNTGDRWLEISDWEQEILKWKKPELS